MGRNIHYIHLIIPEAVSDAGREVHGRANAPLHNTPLTISFSLFRSTASFKGRAMPAQIDYVGEGSRQTSAAAVKVGFSPSCVVREAISKGSCVKARVGRTEKPHDSAKARAVRAVPHKQASTNFSENTNYTSHIFISY